MSSYTPDSIGHPNRDVVLIPVNGETVAIANSGIQAEGVLHVGEMHVFGTPVRQAPAVVMEDRPPEKNGDDYLFQFYMGSLTVVGLFILFRFIQKT